MHMNIRKSALLGAALLSPAMAALAKQRPNIIFFLVDDYGWPESSVAYGDEVYPRNRQFHTPNMERLAQQGVLLTHAYACPVSTPTRASLMSGMNAIHSHITNWVSMAGNQPSDAVGGKNGAAVYEELETDIFRRPDWNINLPKSYLGTDNFGNKPELWNMAAVQNMVEYYGQDIFLTEALTREALKTLEEPVRRGQPFYLYLSHYATHTPIQKDTRFFDRYKKEMGLDAGQSKFSSMVEGVDKSLGDVLDYLEAHHIADNTIIIFMSDNGGNADVKAKGGVPHTQNAPLREGKGSCYQGGIRVPMMVCWPGRTAPGTRIDTPVVPEDLFPTILEMGQVKKYTTSQEVDGKSLVKLLAGKPSDIDPQRPLFFHYPHQWKWEYKSEVDFLSTVIEGDWKLVYVMMNTVPGQRVQDGVPFELYNLREDIGETRNLAAEYPEKVAELARLLGERLRGWNAPMPIVRATGKPVPWPDELLK